MAFSLLPAPASFATNFTTKARKGRLSCEDTGQEGRLEHEYERAQP